MDRKKKEDEEAVRTLEVASLELNNIRRALDQSAIVAITDRKGDIIHVNDKFCEISKYSRTELLGKNHRLINSGHHSREFFVTMWKTISTGKVWEGEIKNRAKDGSFYWVNTTIVPFLDQGGAPYQYVSIRYEITQRKMAEDQLLVYADRLERSNAELQDFASIAAHDLQEPLRKIQTFGDRLGSRWKAALGEEGGDYLNRMLASVTRMRKLIDDLLTYSRVTTETLPFESTDLNKVLRDVLSDLEVRIDQVKGKVHADTLPSLEADPSQMRQLFQNLISNALKFHKVGEPPVIRISSTIRNDAFCTISFVDNGVGFESKDAVRMFAIFQRLHGKHEYEGTGVGLAVCRRIVERHGGSIVAKGKVGEGASFEVTLPLVRRLS
ncbi:PAS domain S-box protein [bacterium]|nr:PAS domain S-box protein [bacterium]